MIIKSYVDYQNALSIIKNSNILAIDTETNGLNTRKNTVIGIGICDERLNSFYLPLYVCTKDTLIMTEVYKFVKPILASLKGKKLIGHNFYFDAEMILNNFGIDLWDDLYADTIMLKHTVDEVPPFGLKPLAKKLWGVDELKEQAEMKESIKANGGGAGEVWMADAELVGKYCEQDVKLTTRLFQYYLPKLKQEGLEDLFFRDEVMPLYKLVTRTMQSGGIPLDLELLNKMKFEIEQDITRIEDEIQEEIKPFTSTVFEEYYLNKEYPVARSGEFAQMVAEYAMLDLPKTKAGKRSLTSKGISKLEPSQYKAFLDGSGELEPVRIKAVQKMLFMTTGTKYMFNLSSKHHLKRLFFGHLGEESIHKTAKGNDQVDDLFLSAMAEKYDWVKKLQTYNKLNKILGTYINRFLDENEDGVFYPEFMQHGTVTARYSSDLQQLPRKLESEDIVAKYTNALRPALIAGEGFKLVGADFSQLEITVFADDAGDPTLLNMIRNKEDFYSRVAIDIYGLGDKYSANKKADNFLKKLNPELRQQMKAVALGIRYGLESFKLHHDLKIEQEEAELIIHNYFKAYPSLKRRMDELIESVKIKGYVSTKTGRKRRLPEIKQFIIEYGEENLNALELYKNYGSSSKYQMMRELRKSIHNKLNASLNFPIQSMAASIVNRAAIAIMSDFKAQNMNAYIAAQIHDELICRVPVEEVDKAMEIMQTRMENTVKLSVPLEAIPQAGDNYGQIK